MAIESQLIRAEQYELTGQFALQNDRVNQTKIGYPVETRHVLITQKSLEVNGGARALGSTPSRFQTKYSNRLHEARNANHGISLSIFRVSTIVEPQL